MLSILFIFMEVIQIIFYILGIIFFLSWATFIGVVTYVVWQLYQSVKDAPRDLQLKINHLFESKKMEMAGMAGVFISSLVLGKIKNKIFGKK